MAGRSRIAKMPLTALQKDVLAILAKNRSEESHFAGGIVLNAADIIGIMSWRRRAFLISAGAAVLLLCVLLLWPEDRGPTYQGKTLAQWLVACDVDDDPSPEAMLAVDAVRQIGTNGLPFLLKRINHECPAWKRKLPFFVPWAIRLRAPYAISRFFQDAGGARADQALNAFAILGQKATPAIPALTNLLSHSERWDTSLRALRALSYIGTNGLAIIVGIVTNTSYPCTHRSVALNIIAGSDTNATCVVPALIDCLNDREMGPQTAVTLGNLKLQPTLVVPALARCLRSKNLLLPESAAESLSEFGTNATVAVPDLIQALDSYDLFVRRAASNALAIIAPEALKKDGH
jgi:hypothetical protein